MAIIANGVINGQLPYTLVGVGVLIGLVIALLDIPILPFALGLYLPLSLTTATMVGGIARLFVNRMSASEAPQNRGLLFASGLVGGDAVMGVIIALFTIMGVIPLDKAAFLPDSLSLAFFLMFGSAIVWVTRKRTS